ncbi:MAG: DUF4249 domain-containing protein [bacterium]|nr:DUF4249 domain-containing protein [bacterium]
MKKIPIILLISTIFLFSCEKVILQQSEPESLIVVEAFLYEGEPVDDVLITSLLLYGGEDTLVQTISDAQIEIIHNNNRYALVSTDNEGNYHYPGTDLDVIEGESYQIEINYFDKTLTAETTVPSAPSGITISDEMYYIDNDLIQTDYDYWANLPELELNWNGSERAYYYILFENIDDFPRDIWTGKDTEGIKIITLPQQGNIKIFRPLEVIFQYGIHRVKVYSVNKEYSDLYESMNQDSRELNEPISNITNGLGVFTAFSSDSISFEILAQ